MILNSGFGVQSKNGAKGQPVRVDGSARKRVGQSQAGQTHSGPGTSWLPNIFYCFSVQLTLCSITAEPLLDCLQKPGRAWALCAAHNTHSGANRKKQERVHHRSVCLRLFQPKILISVSTRMQLCREYRLKIENELKSVCQQV